MNVLIACEESQAVCVAFRKRGHEAYSCDILPCSGGHPEWHIQADVKTLLKDYFDLVIFHPPCTRLSNSGVRWLQERDLWEAMEEAAEFFNFRHKFNSPSVATENPIPHKYAVNLIGRYDQIIQPYMFGHPETKATCLWLKNIPLLKPTNIVEGREGRIWRMPPSPERAKNRSKTFPGIAAAMAEQWG